MLSMCMRMCTLCDLTAALQQAQRLCIVMHARVCEWRCSVSACVAPCVAATTVFYLADLRVLGAVG